ncbi:class I SAM-dependent rRNA methyltransferase [Paenibacillus sacheonensis]|uniref:Methyltransferase domain-containing protein n=1 Tax=Paenibacillus sacheonensis TaxID=742054 RepID=A0A7X4YPZ8_9BACL|nr:class I SAM-dependent rRNA methyltransferase [Paenibacillus sacheonensis]MBM7565633.1 23S rRNA (cytosine1962-C5)-methyltransferase [Paenibacillus sacheonensis]NBC69449.1 methyltransferase domain-containing protein [Paenibacillus sacheonensis]
MERAKAVLKKERKKRTESGHPWIFAGEIDRMEGEAAPGGLVDVVNHQGRYLATGYWNPASQITIRVTAYKPMEEMDEAFFAERLRRCKQHRDRFVNGSDCRLVYGEADFLPGLIVDRFGEVLVVQLLTMGIEVHREALIAALVAVFEPKGIYERSDVSVRGLEGLEERTGTLYGECPRIVEIVENGLKLEVDIVEGQKTGYFFDQRENRASIAPLMKGWGVRSGIRLVDRADTDQAATEADDTGVIAELKEPALVPVNANGKIVTFPYWDGATVLECFAHTGSFTLHACKYGAKKVTCLDVSAHAVETAQRNVERNGFTDRVEFVVADAFEYLRTQVKGIEERAERGNAASAKGAKPDTSKPLASDAGRKWDVVILDPPAFAKSKHAVEGAVRGYKDINLHGMKLVNEGGYLVTASCSYHMRPELFLETIQAAAADAGKILRLIEWRAAGKDHPQILGVNEGHYLKFGIFEVRSRA